MIDCYEHWYEIVSCGGRTCTRAKVTQQIVDAHKRKQIKDNVMEAESSASAATATSTTVQSELPESVEPDDDESHIHLSVKLDKKGLASWK